MSVQMKMEALVTAQSPAASNSIPPKMSSEMSSEMPSDMPADMTVDMTVEKSAKKPPGVSVDQLEEVLEERVGVDRRVNSMALPEGVVERRIAPRRKSD